MDGKNHEANAPSFEHVQPRSRGGYWVEDNLVIACVRCNTHMGAASRKQKMRRILCAVRAPA